jgi:hypothetical protein
LDPLPEVICESAGGDQIDSIPEKLLKVRAETGESKVTDRAVELNQDVDIAVRSSLVSSGRTEQHHAGHPKPLDVSIMGAEHLEDVISAHTGPLSMGSKPDQIIPKTTESRKPIP